MVASGWCGEAVADILTESFPQLQQAVTLFTGVLGILNKPTRLGMPRCSLGFGILKSIYLGIFAREGGDLGNTGTAQRRRAGGCLIS